MKKEVDRVAHEGSRNGTQAGNGGIRLGWLIVEDGLWVSEPGGEFAGMIVKSAEQNYERSDELGHPTGLFPTLEAAEQSL